MKTLLLIGLILTLISITYRLLAWLISLISFLKGNDIIIDSMKKMEISKSTLYFSGLEHVINFVAVLAALLIIY